MPTFSSDGIEIAFDDAGVGTPIVLLHGFAATRTDNWSRTGWYGTLERTGRRVIAADHRGHGDSQKLYEPSDYTADKMTADTLRLMDHLGVESAELMGYSMGAGLAVRLAARHPERFSNLVLAGIGGRMLDPDRGGPLPAEVFETASAEDVTDPMARGFRLYAEQLGQDLKALSACAQAGRGSPDPEVLGSIRVPTLIAAGQRDDLAGDPQALADLIPGAKSETIPGADHMYLLTNGAFKSTVIDFLTGWY